MGSADGALKTAAARVGLTPVEYADRINRGLRWCFRCQNWEPASAFGRDSSRMDGLTTSCRTSRNAAARRDYEPKPRPSAGRRFAEARDGDQRQARARVNYLVDASLIPDPNDLDCVDCGHVYAEGERRHEYDHHRGYAADHHEHVEAVCTTCHHIRETKRKAA